MADENVPAAPVVPPKVSPVQEPANSGLTVSDDTSREALDPHRGRGGFYKIDEATGRRVRA